MIKIIVIGIIIYLIIAFLTLILLLYIDRKDGNPAEFVYDNMTDYLFAACIWPISLPYIVGHFVIDKCKTFVIALVEILVMKSNKNESNNDEEEAE